MMNGTDKVIIALGFFALIGFISYLYFLKTTPTNIAYAPVPIDELSTSDRANLNGIRERYVLRR